MKMTNLITIRDYETSDKNEVINLIRLNETDDQTYVLVTLRAHELFGVGAKGDVQEVIQNSDQANGQVGLLTVSTLGDVLAFIYQANDQASDQARKIISEQIHSKVIDLLDATHEWTKRKELFEKLDLSNHTTNRARYLDPLISFFFSRHNSMPSYLSAKVR